MPADLVVVASSFSTPVIAENTWVLRLTGLPVSTEVSPPDLLRFAEAAAVRIQREFGDWLWRWVEKEGADNLDMRPGPVSWWWLAPLSEKSHMRSPLIRELYWLTLLTDVLAAYPVRSVRWIGDDRLIGNVAAELVRGRGIACELDVLSAPRFSGLARSCASRLKWTASQIIIWGLLKLRPISSKPAQMPAALLYSRFPVLWEESRQGWRERMYGDWAEYLREKGVSVGYAAVYSGTILQLFRRRREFQKECEQQGIQLLEPTLSLQNLLGIHFSGRLWWRYWCWRRKLRAEPVRYSNVDISPIFWREMDRSALSGEVLFNEAIIAGFRRLLHAQGLPNAVFHPFEYQPMERAVAAGVRASGIVPIIGLQTGLFTANQLGLSLSADELRRSSAELRRAPAPDILAAYGELPYRIYVDRLGRDRVCLSGAVRYPRLGIVESFDAGVFQREHDLPKIAEFIFVATPAGRDEAMPVLAAAFAVAAETPTAFLLIKFHYHSLLPREVSQLAAEYGISRYRMFDADLYKLIQFAPVMITGGSSICLEALALGTMPVVYVTPGEMSFNPALEVPQAVFLWHTVQELKCALRSCIDKDADYEARRKAWPKAVAAQLFKLDGRANERLFEFLRERHVL